MALEHRMPKPGERWRLRVGSNPLAAELRAVAQSLEVAA